MNASPYVPIARVIKTHGLNGEVSVVPAAEASLSLLAGLEVWFVPPPAGTRTAHIDSVRQGPKGPLVKFREISDVDSARAICGAEMIMRESDVPDAWLVAPDEDDDLSGYTLMDRTHGRIGEIQETIVTGANDVWVVEGPFGEVLVPVIDDVVRHVDDMTRTIDVVLLDGLLPGSAEEL